LTDYLNEGKIVEGELFPGKIAIITGCGATNYDIYHSADRLIKKYGSDKFVHVAWPENFIAEQDSMIDIVSALAEDSEIKALIINQAVPGTEAAVDKFKKAKHDAFIIYCTIHEPNIDNIMKANLILNLDELSMGSAMVKQARKQGAKAFVHYSIPRHMSQLFLSGRQIMIRETCEAEGILFMDVMALDPMGEAGFESAKQFILEDVPKIVAKYGEDTAFFCTNCFLQAPLIKAVVDCHAIYPQPCCPSPFHGFPEAFGIKTDGGQIDLNYLINETCRVVGEKNMTDRLSTWPVSVSILFSNVGGEYAIKWLKGEVSKKGINNRVLLDCMNEYIKEVVGEGVEVEMSSYSEKGIIYDNFKQLLMSYLDF